MIRYYLTTTDGVLHEVDAAGPGAACRALGLTLGDVIYSGTEPPPPGVREGMVEVARVDLDDLIQGKASPETVTRLRTAAGLTTTPDREARRG